MRAEGERDELRRIADAAANPAVFYITDDRALYAAHKELAAALAARTEEER